MLLHGRTPRGLWAFLAALALYVVAQLLLGCASRSSQYREGVHLDLGMYVPTSEGLVGLNVLDYLSGIAFHTASNMPFTVTREHSASNTYLGVVNVRETTKTTISAGGEE